MKQLRVAIVTDDSAYGEALMRGLRYRSRAFLVTLHSICGFIDGWKKGGIGFRRNYDLILWDGPDGKKIRGENILWITDRIPVPENSSDRDENTHVLYRYDRASGFYTKLMDTADRSGADVPGFSTDGTAHLRTRIIAFGSWHGGVGCTTLCRAVGQELTRFFGKRVLWLSLDGIEPGCGSEALDPHGCDAAGVDRFLYEILADETEDAKAADHMVSRSTSADSRKNRLLVIDRFTARDGYGLETLRSSMGRNPLPHLGSGDAAKVIGSIAGMGSFDALLIDVGTCTGDGAAEMIAFADRVCLRGKGNEERKNRYMRWICNALYPADGGSDGSEKKDRIIMADDVPDVEGDEEILLEGEYGKYIHALTEALWYNEIEQIA